MGELKLDIHGIVVRCTSKDRNLLGFVERNLGLFVSDFNPEDLAVQCNYSRLGVLPEVTSLAAQAGAKSQAGPGLFVGPGIVVWTEGDLYQYALRLDHNKLYPSLSVNHGLKQKVKGIGRAVLRPERHRQIKGSRSTHAMRFLIHFPVFWLLESTRGIAVIHGAAVARDGRAIVLTGLDGVGKSTLAMYLCQHRGFSLLSDNFVLTDGERIFSFPEMTRLGDEAIQAVGMADQYMEQLGERWYLSTNHVAIAGHADCVAIIMNQLGSRLGLSPVAPWDTEADLKQMWCDLPEFLDYGRFRTICQYLGGDVWPNDNATAVKRLAARCPCYLLVKDTIGRLSEAADLVEQCI